MQPYLDGPRAGLTERLVRSLLQGHRTIQVLYGADALDNDFSFVADIGSLITEGSTIVSSLDATIHRTCILNIDADVTATGWSYLSGFVKPYMIFRDPESGEEARFNLGVYTLTTPQRRLGVEPATLAFAGYDLIYLLRQPIGDSYEVAAGSDPAQAAAEVIGLAVPEVEVVVEDSGSVTTTQLTWPFDPETPTTYLDVVMALLSSIGYRPVWVDWEGRFRIEGFVDLQTAPVEWVFDADALDSIVAEDRSQDIDVYTVPNWWRFVMADLTDTPVEGVTMFTFEDDSPLNPGSTVNRGRTTRHIEQVHAVTFEDLVDYAQRRIAQTLEPGEQFTVSTQPFPLAWHYDVIDYRDTGLSDALPAGVGGRRIVVGTEWRLPLDGMNDMEWKWQTVIDQSATDTFLTETDDPATRDDATSPFSGDYTLAGSFTGSNTIQFSPFSGTLSFEGTFVGSSG